MKQTIFLQIVISHILNLGLHVKVKVYRSSFAQVYNPSLERQKKEDHVSEARLRCIVRPFVKNIIKRK